MLDFGADGYDRLRRHVGLSKSSKAVHVQAVALADLRIDPTTGKTATVVDLRR